jgi:hypothetical protein
MENQVSVGDQNTQQIGQNSVNQPVTIQEKPKTNYLMKGRRFNSPILRVIFLLALLVLIVGVINIAGRKEKSFLRPSPVSATEIIRRNLEKFIKPNTIYHEKTKQRLGGNNEFNTYEIWEDQESERFYNEATYSDGRKTVQGFNLEFHWDVDYSTKKIHKDIYVYEPQSGPQPVGRRVDIAEQFDGLIRNGVLEAKEGILEGREVYVVYDTRTSPEKIWDVLTFDKQTFQILRTEKYGADKKLEELIAYEIQEAIERNETNLAKFFTYQDPGNNFSLYQRKFYTSKPDQEDYVLVSDPQTTPVSTIIPTRPPEPVGKVSFAGTVKTGAQLGEIKSYCPNGLYLVAAEGTYLVNQTEMLLLQLSGQPDGTKMLSDPKYVGKKVEVVGKYPTQENFCEALICECEDYILVDTIIIVD